MPPESAKGPEIKEEGDASSLKVNVFTFSLMMKTVSEANVREHWAQRARRAKGLRQAGCFHTLAAVQRFAGVEVAPWSLLSQSSPMTVLLTRVAPRALDDDNLAGAFKAFRDGVADAFRIDDRDPRVRWSYGQRSGKLYGIEVTISWPAG